jgi:Tfp pilus assembly protein PilF
MEVLVRAEALLLAGKLKAAHALCMQALVSDKEQPTALFLLGVIASEQGAYTKAIDIFERAIRRDSANPRLLAHYAKALSFLSRHEAALSAAGQAAAVGAPDPMTLDTIGVVFSRAGRHEEALVYFDLATQGAPDVASFQFNRAASLQFSGRFADAETAYKRALALDPAMHRALSALPHLRRQSREHNVIKALEQAFADAGDDATKRLHLGHALAKTYEDLGAFERSLDWLAAAKAGVQSRADEAASRDAAVFAAARRTAPGAGAANASEAAPVFIVGLPRTGTTLTDRILSSHPELSSAGELGLFALLVKRAGSSPSRFVLDADALAAAADGVDLARVGKDYIEAASARLGSGARFIDKMPLNFFYAGLICRALPKARIICLRRNPMDACLSNYRQLLATGPSNYDYALRLETCASYYAEFARLAAHWKTVLPAQVYTELWYEDLVADFETEVRRLIAFVDLPWDDRCLAFYDNAAPVATASAVQVRSPLYAHSVDRWRRYGDALAPLREALLAKGVRIDPSEC